MNLSPARLAALLAIASCAPPARGGPPIEQGPVLQVPNLEQECNPFSAAALRLCVDRARLERDVALIALPRAAGSEHHARVRELCVERLTAAGFSVERHEYGTGINVIGSLLGVTRPEERVLVAAHYDHIDGCQGADDNASGVAALLETARTLATARFERTLVVACWDEFERGALGSMAHAKRARARAERLVASYAFEAVGYASSKSDTQRLPPDFERFFPDRALSLLDRDYRADFLLVVADDRSEAAAAALARHAEAVALPIERLQLTERLKYERKGVHRRDQASFWDEQLPAVLLTDSGPYRNPRVRCAHGPDAPDTLDYAFATRVTQAAVGAIAELLAVR